MQRSTAAWSSSSYVPKGAFPQTRWKKGRPMSCWDVFAVMWFFGQDPRFPEDIMVMLWWKCQISLFLLCHMLANMCPAPEHTWNVFVQVKHHYQDVSCCKIWLMMKSTILSDDTKASREARQSFTLPTKWELDGVRWRGGADMTTRNPRNRRCWHPVPRGQSGKNGGQVGRVVKTIGWLVGCVKNQHLHISPTSWLNRALEL